MPNVFAIWREQIKRRDDAMLNCGIGYTSIPGTYTIEATHRDWPRPIAVVWWRWTSPTAIDILDSLVQFRLRRCGLRTWLNERLFAYYPQVERITSWGATPAGEAFMLASGYMKSESGWELLRGTKRRRRNA